MDLKEGNIGLGSFVFDFYTGGWEWEHVDLSLMDIGHVEVSAELNDEEVNVGAFASAWSPSFSVTIFGVKIEIGAEVGAIGGSVNIESGSISVKGAAAVGATLSISW